MVYTPTIKRLLDLVFALICMAALMPVFIIAAAAILIEDGPPVFYRQQRVGRHGKFFEILKFRSMSREERDLYAQVKAGSQGILKSGHIIRRLKIDELPQLWNVLNGDLSLVGPRPCLPDTIEEFGEFSDLRHSIRPGITGLSQINGNIALTWKERLDYDVRYIREQSLMLDLYIIFMTIYVVIFGDEKRVRKP